MSFLGGCFFGHFQKFLIEMYTPIFPPNGIKEWGGGGGGAGERLTPSTLTGSR